MNLSQIFDEAVQGIEDGLYSIINHPSLVLLNILAFIILMIFVKKFLWEKVTHFIELRQKALMEAMETADLERARAQELQAKSSQDYEKMKEETRQLKEKLTIDAYRVQEELILSAKKEAQRRLEQTELDIQFEIAQANAEIKQSIKEIAFLAAEKIVKREIDESVHQDIIDSILEENGQS